VDELQRRVRVGGRQLLQRISAHLAFYAVHLSFDVLGICFTLKCLEIDALSFAPLLQQPETLLKVVVDLFERTAVRMSLLVNSQIVEEPAALGERTPVAATVAVIEDALDVVCLVHAPADVQEPGAGCRS